MILIIDTLIVKNISLIIDLCNYTKVNVNINDELKTSYLKSRSSCHYSLGFGSILLSF